VDGLDRDQLARTTAASSLTLAGLLKHLTLVEDHWFGVILNCAEPDKLWRDMTSTRTGSSAPPSTMIPPSSSPAYERTCARSRAAVAATESLDALSVEVTRRRGPSLERQRLSSSV
jgi:hypothetical protein